MAERHKMLIKFMFVYWFTINLCTCKELELELLLSMKASLNDQFQSLITWNSSVSFCKWDGITCYDAFHVSKIELPGKNLSGKVSESIFRLPYIETIDLSGNQFFGDIPRNLSCFSLRYLNLSDNNLTGMILSSPFPSLETLDLSNNILSGEIPQEIGLFSGLKNLDFGGNYLVGKIPNSISNMTRLEFLTLASNQLVGEIPRNLGFMKSLKWIYLGYNSFSGEIPKEIGELPLLNHLDLVYNNLTGKIHSSLGNLTNLEYLFLYFNKLSGPIPDSIFNLKKLVSLDLSDNFLTDEIPDLFKNLQDLEILHLFSNNFTGKIPNSLTILPHLQVIQLWSNRLSGEIPEDLGKNSNLTILDLSTNNLIGKIPENLCASGCLFKLILFSNSLENGIPVSLSYCKSLQRVRIQKNRLFGELSREFARLPQLNFLDISSNNLFGRIDDRKWDMPQLQMLNLAQNEFFGHLPSSFGSKKLENLDLSGNSFSGSIPVSFGEFSQLMELKLSENQLSGRIPDELSYCKKLVSLDLSNNHLNGEIPTNFSAMPVLGHLDLSVNELTGKIPSNLGKVESLVQVNISHNHFFGCLPSTGAFIAINSSSVEGNNLCGGEKTSGLPPCKRISNRTHWLVLTSTVFLSLIVVAIVGFVAIFIRQRKAMELKSLESEDGTIWELHFLNSRVSRSITIKDVISSMKGENLIARGKASVSYKGKSTLHKQLFLTKEIDHRISIKHLKEWTELFKVNHPNVVKLLAICSSKKGSILVYEYIEGKGLSEALPCLDWERRLKIAIEIAKALRYLHYHHSSSIIVGNVSPRKIIIDEKKEAHLRLSTLPWMNQNKCFNSSSCVSPEFEEPKVVSTYEKSDDVYSFGLVLIELLTGKLSVNSQSMVEWARSCYSDCHLETWVDLSIKNHAVDNQNQIVETMDLALKCTAGDPVVRPCATQIVKILESIVRYSPRKQLEFKWFVC